MRNYFYIKNFLIFSELLELIMIYFVTIKISVDASECCLEHSEMSIETNKNNFEKSLMH